MPSDTVSILVVDDVRLDREILRHHLEAQGHHPVLAENGQQAMQILEQRRFDLVLLDIVMPVMDGYQVLERMKSHPRLRHMPVIVVSAVEETMSVVRCIEMGAEDYLTKPFNRVLLSARISNCLQKKHLRDQEQFFLKNIAEDKERPEHLMKSVIPKTFSSRLKKDKRPIVDYFTEITIMFANIVDIEDLSEEPASQETIQMMDGLFDRFDHIALQHNLEKVKTIGDSYMVVGGIPSPFRHHAEAVAGMALDIQEILIRFRLPSNEPLSMRIGIHTGPVRVGILESGKFSYDLWGETVTAASALESLGIPDQIQVSGPVYERLKDEFTFVEREDRVAVSGMENETTYLLTGRKGPHHERPSNP
ncbi:Chemotaxis regulator - transmits chemoreceptor signals to flagellar motor components CheY [Olavius algarvensis associated proteobacterium Delta 3]|nr:Chemotaxis regulator - transmits chemoreceptor signals to flagellar motor components CheY [Olavius algarvensis associated proteobacterium Delta 3]CAB5162066.1 Chemotaxis regulator - transmits chemoreceptor signals to flagellar motor components CheY [Olavius algarvensis associated proteobacterium Delta 3]